MKVALFISGIVLVIALFIIVAGVRQRADKRDGHYLLNYLKHHKNWSLTVVRNGETLKSVREDEMLPLASAVKTIIAIEYAKQCREQTLDPSHSVSLEELERYYIPNTDGGAHEDWMAYSKDKGLLPGNSTTLENVVKGMIAFSSNANTDYLMDLLGVNEINGLLDDLSIEKHEALYPVVGALLIPTYLKMKGPSYTNDYIESKVKEMSKEEYIRIAQTVSQNLKEGEKGLYLENWHSSKRLDKIWSDRLTRSTTFEYATLMGKLNSKTFFQREIQERLDAVMEVLMESPINREWLMHAGQKGGSTEFLVTNAAYATDKEGNSTEIAIFTNELGAGEFEKISGSLNSFMLNILRDEDFRNKLKEL
ncbi:class A beta-lactamase-related serine hydrolase [Rossellomorea aquimaris]|uniref:serine hydrolase n=1 Tax=Rossellomorea aquimaris TaxID=189382 RepID=UPI001CD5443C|nr:serine hydrolase [Rossellomorea aquimaris]MCA1060633.1 class A beta-lactamase-related serine hydrolase [Rossellomorea aquimaris]